MAEPPETNDPAIACTLGADDMDARLGEWQTVLALVEDRRPTEHGMRLQFPLDGDVLAAVARLTAREVECCAFFTFTLVIDPQTAWLEVAAPPDAVPLVQDLFGSADR